MRKLTALILFFSVFTIYAQEEFNAVVTVNADKVSGSNKQVYQTLQKSITEFINQTKWTKKKFLPQERIQCAFTIIVNAQDNNNFSASLQVQATRPVYGASYETPILNINDSSFEFQYTEFQPLIYNPNSFDNNLVSTIVFYVYTILGVDADSFELNSGQRYFEKAENVVRQAQQSGGAAWQDKMGEQNRFALIDGFLSPKYSSLRSIFYTYHRRGLDTFESNPRDAKVQIANTLLGLEEMYNVTIGNYLLRVFLDAKSNEIVNIFSDGKSSGLELRVQEMLQKISPTQSSKWSEIKL